MIVLVDCDGVLADFVGAVLTPYNARHGTHYTHADVRQWDIPKSLNIPAAELYADVAPGFCSQIPAYPGAREAIERMREVATVVCLTAGWDTVDTWDAERRDWLARECGFKKNDVIFAAGERKNLVGADLFFDDKDSTVVSWAAAQPAGKAVIFRQPWNQDLVTDDYVCSLAEMATVTRVLAVGHD